MRNGLLALVLLICSLPACADGSAGAQKQDGIVRARPLPELLATVGGGRVTLTDVRESAGLALDRLELEYQRSRHELVDSLLHDLLRERLFEAEAARRNQSVDQLITSELGDIEPSDAEIEAWYVANAGRVGRRSLEQVRDRVAETLREQRREAVILSLEQRLAAGQDVRVFLEPFRYDLDSKGAPYMGSSNAPVELVEFSDFQCSYCARFAQTLEQVHAEFGDDVRIVYRQFPLTRVHAEAFKAAEASLCAHEQGKFWAMHDAMFQQQEQLSIDELQKIARLIDLDGSRFDACLSNGRFAEQVERDVREGRTLGVTGTPTLFVNGVPLKTGAQPFEVVARAVQEELQHRRR